MSVESPRQGKRVKGHVTPPAGRFLLLLRKSRWGIGGEARQDPQTPMLDGRCEERWWGV